ncbi:MAG: trypsin-like peptidase domain-containing protein [Alphaproteobacteria bacterium]|nr:trypsin-like peptidase domain-containing protein [Alphaproteobacteria bacterium]
MKRAVGLAGVVLAAGLLASPPPAFPGIPVSAFAQMQGLPTLAPVIKAVAASVVSITVRAEAADGKSTSPGDVMDDPLMRDLLHLPVAPQYRTFAAGSGVIINAVNGYIVTNYHVIKDAEEINVDLVDGRHFRAKLAGADPDTDVALIQISAANLSGIPLGDSDALNVGDFVLAIGNPFGIGQTVTSGIVSGLNRNHMGLEGYEDFIQTDASINPGNSGGALVNLRGELVGINTAIVDVMGGNAGIGFAIPVNMVRAISVQLEKYGSVERGELGFAMSALTPDAAKKAHVPAGSTGVVVTKVDEHSAAERAGVKPGDVVTAIGGTPVQDVPDLRNRLALLRVGDAVELTVLRGSRRISVRAVIDEPAWRAIDGIEITELLDGAVFTNTAFGADPKGVQVATVRSGSNAWASGLREGDILTSVNSRRVIALDQFVTEAGKAVERLNLEVIRNGEKLLLQIRMNQAQPG